MQGHEPVPPPGWTDQLEREFRSVERDRHIRICYAGDVLNKVRLADIGTRARYGAPLAEVVARLGHGRGTGLGRRRLDLLVAVGAQLVPSTQTCLGNEEADFDLYEPPWPRVFEDIHHLLVCDWLARLGWRMRTGRDITPSEAQRLEWDDLAEMFHLGSHCEEGAVVLVPDPEDIRRGLQENRPELYEALVDAGTLDAILESLHAQATAIGARALVDGLAPDQAQELAREAKSNGEADPLILRVPENANALAV